MKIATYLTLLLVFSTNLLSIENPTEDIISDEIIPIGEVKYLRGEAYRNGTKLNIKSSVYEGDTIRTLKSSVVRIAMINESTLTIAPETEMILEEFKSNDENLIHLLKGVMRAKVRNNPANKENSLIVKSETAALGVRGTDFQFTYNKKNNVSSVLTFEGIVAFKRITSSKFHYNDLDRELSKSNTYEVKQGEFSSNNLKYGIVNIPTRISSTQFYGLKKNVNYLSSKVNTKNYRPTIPSGVPSKIFNSPSQLSNTTKVKNGTSISGTYNKSTNQYAPASGGFLDAKTGLYIEPDSKSNYLKEQNLYNPSKEVGTVNSKTGEYIPPKGFKLTPNGEFKPTSGNLKKAPPKLNFNPKKYDQEVRLIPKDNSVQEKTFREFTSYTNTQSTEAIKQIQQEIIDYNNQNTANQSNTTQLIISINEP